MKKISLVIWFSVVALYSSSANAVAYKFLCESHRYTTVGSPGNYRTFKQYQQSNVISIHSAVLPETGALPIFSEVAFEAVKRCERYSIAFNISVLNSNGNSYIYPWKTPYNARTEAPTFSFHFSGDNKLVTNHLWFQYPHHVPDDFIDMPRDNRGEWSIRFLNPEDVYPYQGNTSSNANETSGVPNTCGGNPIDLFSGNKYQVEMDFDGYGDRPLGFSRYYNASSGLGVKKWRHSYSEKLIFNTDINDENKLFVTFVDSNGGEYNFHNPSGQWKLESSSGANSFQLIDNRVGQSPGWVVLDPVGNVYNFDLTGHVTKITDQNNLSFYIHYPSSTTMTVENDFGHSILLTYDDERNLVSVLRDGVNSGLYEYMYKSQNGDDKLLEKVIYPDGNERVYNYHEENNRLESIEDEEGKIYASWEYLKQQGLIRASVSYHGQEKEKYAYQYSSIDESGKTKLLTEETGPLGRVTKYYFDVQNGQNQLTKVEGIPSANCLGADTSYTYDSNGYRLTETNARGYVTRTVHNARGLIGELTTGLEWTGSANNQVLATTNATQRATTVWHPTLALPQDRTFAGYDAKNGVWVDYRKEHSEYENGRLKLFEVTDLTDISEPYATNNRTRTWNYDYEYFDSATQKKIKKLVLNGPRATSEISDGVDDITTYHYDESGNLTSVVNAYGHTISYSDYNGRGQPTTITDANNVETTLTYTARGWLDTVSTVLDEGTAVTDYDYYKNGLLKKLTLADGSFLEYEYNDARHLTKVTNAFGEVLDITPSTFDGSWKKVETRDNALSIKQSIERSFDELGRVMELLPNQNQPSDQHTKFRYDVNNNPEFVDNSGYRSQDTSAPVETLNTQSVYDELDRIIQHIDANNKTTQYFYDVQGNVNLVVDAEFNHTSYLYDGFGQLMRRVSDATGVTDYSYDSAGNLTTKTTANNITTTYEYDALSRITRRDSGDDYVNWKYDRLATMSSLVASIGHHGEAIGRLSWMQDNNLIQAYQYNKQGLLVKHVYKPNNYFVNKFLFVGYDYDLAGNQTSMMYPSGNVVTYNRVNGRMDNVQLTSDVIGTQPLVTGIEHFPYGEISGMTYGNGLTLDVKRNLAGLIELITLAGEEKLWEVDLDYDNFNNVKTLTTSLAEAKQQSFFYDKLHRLSHADLNDSSFTYGYDAVGNRTSINVTGDQPYQATYDYIQTPLRLDALTNTQKRGNSHKINMITGTNGTRSFSYDNMGSRKSDSKLPAGGNASFTYDNNERLKTMTINH